jgi:hypothetical protein
MVTGPDRLEIHIHVCCPPPRRTGPSLGALIFLLVCWPLVLTGWAIWFFATLLLTFAGMVIVAAALTIWGAGRLIALRWPDAGGGVVAIGRGIFTGTVHAVDRMNGHG